MHPSPHRCNTSGQHAPPEWHICHNWCTYLETSFSPRVHSSYSLLLTLSICGFNKFIMYKILEFLIWEISQGNWEILSISLLLNKGWVYIKPKCFVYCVSISYISNLYHYLHLFLQILCRNTISYALVVFSLRSSFLRILLDTNFLWINLNRHTFSHGNQFNCFYDYFSNKYNFAVIMSPGDTYLSFWFKLWFPNY